MLYFGLSQEEIGYQIAGLINDHNFLSRKRGVNDILNGRINYIVEAHGRYIIGAVGVHRQSHTFTEIKHLVVRPEWRQKGVGRFLVQRAMNLADSRMVFCTVRGDNAPSLSLFQELEFRKVGEYTAADHKVIILARVAPRWLMKKPGLELSFSNEELQSMNALRPLSESSTSGISPMETSLELRS